MEKMSFLNKTAILATIATLSLTGCAVSQAQDTTQSQQQTATTTPSNEMTPSENGEMPSSPNDSQNRSTFDGSMPQQGMREGFKDNQFQGGMQSYSSTGTSTFVSFVANDLFTERDLAQEADLSSATNQTVESNNDITITSEGVYVLSGTASDVTIIVEASDSDKVQLVLDNLNVTNTTQPVIYVKSADKVFITTAQGSSNTLSVTSTFTADGDTNTDAVIFAKDDITLNGQGTLIIKSSDNGITSKDDLKVTGGTYIITSEGHALEANDSIRIYDGSFRLESGKDGMHAENDDDDTLGYIYIANGSFETTSGSDAIHANSALQIDNGTMTLNAREALEGTYIQVNGGDITISASDDGINSARQSSLYTPTIEITGGNLDITMGSGDTDALDANGNLIITGGNVNISAQFAFDYDGTATFTGGTVMVNGSQVTSITNSMMGGMGGMGGNMQGGRPGEMQGNMQGGMPEDTQGQPNGQMPYGPGGKHGRR